MFAETRYISWAMRLYGSVAFDLASSGIPQVSLAEVGGVSAAALEDKGGYAALRAAIARYNDVPEAEVVPALGTAHAIFLAYAALLSPGDELVVESPGYEPLTRAAEGLGAVVRTFERRADEGFRVVPERAAALMSPRTRAIVVTNLHNPSGVRVDDATLRELALVAEARGAYLLVDEVYAPFVDLPRDGVFRASARKLAPNVVAVGSLTKCYGLGMQRLGWLLGPEAIATRAEHATVATIGHPPLAWANIGVAALSAVGALAARAGAQIGDKRALAEAWVRAQPGATWSAPREGLFGFVSLPGRGDLRERIERAARAEGVLVAAGAFFGAPEGFRLSWATSDPAAFSEGLRRLESITHF